ncbi:type IV conjugative transfer system lipoprotein TraV [Budviciaceae bacterium BWR-B9]|uniref:Type IV conjugative transfer system lipoprotein TraV n=1 Tax=Limnobaculum allomyrinae TaxID=2791986 RepID=A0ABS1IVH5_9GAMM|nr:MULTISPECIES: type IV conjugative transfer system lipoprotein TraV [Limnobaculum]MBK5145546.1 type IV conjugative transfer system lipoprotein TraV [Limnobaculum allomyrinae]MBV7693664.1 type IV conjugative transfer system lipoprotein TraV [Limnobaculum sp. M2-1]
MRFISISLLTTVLLLTGCAGVNSEFECNATTSDSCMTMEEANQKAKSMTYTSKAVPAAGVSQGQVSALPELALTSDAVVPETPAQHTKATNPFNKDERLVFTPINLDSEPQESEVKALFKHSAGAAYEVAKQETYPMQPLVTLASCTVTTCPQEKKVTAHRLNEGTARLWVAPYVDADDVLHQPGHVLFVVKPSSWQQIQSVN